MNLPEINLAFFIRLGLGLLIIAAGAVVTALLLLIPTIGIAVIGGILGLWVLVLSYQLGNVSCGLLCGKERLLNGLRTMDCPHTSSD
jgi:hypothetical protein